MTTSDPGSPEQGRPDPSGYPPAPGGFGNAPQYSGGYAEPAAPTGPPPKEVRWASWAMYAAVALSLIGLIVTLTNSSGFKDAIRKASPNLTADEVDTAYTGAVIFAIVVTVLIAAIYVVLATQLLKGKNWARITTWVVVGLFTLLGLLGLGSDAPALSRLLGILTLVANAATLVLLALKPSNQFFASRKAVR